MKKIMIHFGKIKGLFIYYSTNMFDMFPPCQLMYQMYDSELHDSVFILWVLV